MDTKEIVIAFIKENLSEIRNTENHRNNITSIILVLVGGILSIVSDNKLSLDYLPLTIFIIVIGLFGILVTRKLYERQKWYMGRVDSLYKQIDKLDPNLKIQDTYKELSDKHERTFKLYSNVRMNFLWTLIHFFVLVIGIVLTVFSIINQ